MGEYYIIITDAGVALEASAHAAGEPVVLNAFGVCDGGAAFRPDPAQTTLANEVYRGDISSLSVSADDTSVLEAQCIIPASSGGYTIRGIGLYAGDTLYAVGNYPDQPKPAPDSGYAASLEILAQLAVSDTADVTLNVTDGTWLTKTEGDQLYVPLTRKVNGHELTADLTLTPADIGAVPPERTINGHALKADVNVTAQDIFNGQAIGLSTEDLDTLKTPGIYYQPLNANASAARHYPENNAGTLLVYKNAGVTQVYIVYNSSRTYTRSQYSTGAWTTWAKQYDTANKPTPEDIGALNADGNAVSATKLQTARKIGGVAFDGTADISLPGVNTQGNQSTTGNAASATKLQTARTINGVAFDGTANITLPLVGSLQNGSYILGHVGPQNLEAGATLAGSQIIPSCVSYNDNYRAAVLWGGSALAGTWRLCGHLSTQDTSRGNLSLFMRVA